jgi:hypothetical protein
MIRGRLWRRATLWRGAVAAFRQDRASCFLMAIDGLMIVAMVYDNKDSERVEHIG